MVQRSRWFGVTVALILAVPIAITLSAAPAGAVTVGDEAALRAAFGIAATTQIDLTADITLDDCGAGDVSRTSDTPLILNGHGFTIEQMCDDERVLDAAGAGSLTVQDATITGGDADDAGGGVHYSGGAQLNIVDSVVTGNHANGPGGGVEGNQLHITDSTFAGNSTDDFCSAACSGSTIDIVGSTFTGDTFGDLVIATGEDDLTITDSSITGSTIGGVYGGSSVTAIRSTFANISGENAIASDGNEGVVTLINSTVSGNTAEGAAIFSADINLVYATVVDNEATDDDASNLEANDDLTSFGSVVALPRGGNPACAVDGSTTSEGFNFSDDDSCGFTETDDGDRENGGDPGLGALADNGGTMLTRAPGDTSPLLDFIPSASCEDDSASGITTDQVGTSRPQEDGCEIGAFEVPTPEPPAPPGAPPAPPAVVQPTFTG